MTTTMMIDKKVLIVSNNSFSKSTSNGRTLGNFFQGWPKENIAQFCLSTREPDFDVCENYYFVTDREAFSAFTHFRKAKRVMVEDVLGTQSHTNVRKGKKTPMIKTAFKSLVRNIVWSCRIWDSTEFQEWLDKFNPDLVLSFVTDTPSILDIGRIIAVRKKIPLAMYSSEGFYFFENNYLPVENLLDKIAYPIFHRLYKRSFELFMKHVNYVIYLNKKLEDDYQKCFHHNSSVIYTSSDVQFDEDGKNIQSPVFSYLGNFGLNRQYPLMEIGKALHTINSEYKLDLYGNIPDKIKQEFEKCDGVRVKGLVSYDEVKNVIKRSTILFHAESQEKELQDGLRYGFSTKIADSVSSGHCFLNYSSRDIAGAQYIIETKAGWFVEDQNDLVPTIMRILVNYEERSFVLSNAKEISSTNHNKEHNKIKFMNCLLAAIDDYNLKKQ